jgi:hypothetical protein
VIAELALVLVETAVVVRPEDVVEVFVVDHRHDEDRRHLARVEHRVDADLGRVMVV